MSENDAALAKAFLSQFQSRIYDQLTPDIRERLSQLKEGDLWFRPTSEAQSAGDTLLRLRAVIRRNIMCSLGGANDDWYFSEDFSELDSPSKGELLDLLAASLDESRAVFENLAPSSLTEVVSVDERELTRLGVLTQTLSEVAELRGELDRLIQLIESER